MVKEILRYFKSFQEGRSLLETCLQAIVMCTTVAFIGAVIFVTSNGSLVYDFIKRMTNHDQIIEVENALVVSTQINELIANQRATLGLDRMYVSRFHNGKVDVSGVHFVYLSRVSESTAAGVSNEINRTQSLPLSIFPEMLQPLLQNQCYYVEKVDNTVENSRFLTEMGVNSKIVCPVLNVEGRIIGVVGVDGVINSINSGDASELIESLKLLSTVLGGMLTLPQ